MWHATFLIIPEFRNGSKFSFTPTSTPEKMTTHFRPVTFARAFAALVWVSLAASASAVNINSGGSATGTWIADAYFNTGTAFSSTATINTSGVTNPAPPAVYQTVRWATAFTYTVPGLTAGGSYTVRLHFCELTWTAAGQRKFNVAINGTNVLTNYDVFASAGAQNKAVAQQFNATANGSGQIVIAFSQGSPVIDNPDISGIEITANVTVPSAPTGLGATAGNAQVTLSWTASSGATSYNVYRGTTANGESTTAIATGITTTSYTNTGLTNGTTYYYKVTASNSAGTSGYSNEASATPTAPVSVVNINSGGPATGSWIADAYFNTGSTFSSAATINTSGVTNPAPAAVYQTVRWATAFTYTVPGLTAGGTYTVRLHLVELTWTAAGQRKFNAAINGTNVLTNYDVFAAAGAQNKAVAPQFNATANGSGQIVIAFTQGSPVVDNPDVAGIEIQSSTPTAPAAPTGLAATPGNAQISLSWNASAGATSYSVYRGTSANGESTTAIASGLTTTTYTNTGLTNGTAYYYKVKATNSVGTSGYSNEASATPVAPPTFWPSGGSADTNLQSTSAAWGTWRGRTVDLALAYPTRNAGWSNLISTTSGQIGAWTDHTVTLIVQISPFPENVSATYAALVAGSYDSFWQQFGTNLKNRENAGFKPVIVDVAWEANGTYFAWGGRDPVNPQGSQYTSASQYIAGFQRIVSQIRVTYPTVKIGWVMNGHGTPSSIGSDSSVLYPGDSYVDYIGVDYYDHYPSAPDQTSFNTEGNAPDGIWWFLAMARSHGKKFLVPEWGVAPGSGSNGGGDNANFITWMFGVFQNANNTGDMGGETYFDDPCSDTGNVESDLINGCNPLSAARYLQLY
jgi:fibronectin type 3 domain-containing protein